MIYPPSLVRLIEALRCLPGVGPKSAQRMAFHLSRRIATALACSLKRCRRRWTASVAAAAAECSPMQSCVRSARRPPRSVAAVCGRISADVAAIEQSGSYRGTYFVLMGHLSPLDGIGPDQLGFAQLEALLAEG